MSGLHHSVATAFGVSHVIREKGYYKTVDGKRVIRKTKDACEQILARYEIIERCIQAGYPWVERFYMSQSGKPYVAADGGLYVMTDLIRCPDANFSELAECLKAVRAIARWHSCARGAGLTLPLYKGRPPIPLIEEYRTQSEAIASILKRVRKQSKWSDFDVMFLKSCPDYGERIQQALQLMEGTSYLKRFNKAKQAGHICHGGLKEACLRICGEHVFITKFDHIAVDYQLNDLCSLVRRGQNAGLEHEKILEAYNQIIPLDEEEEVILEAMLLYPNAFVKLVTEYYQKRRSWTPIAMANKMREILA